MNLKKDNLQTIYNLISQVVLNGTNFVLIMLFTRFLSTDNYGVVSIYQAYVLFFAIIIGLNVQGTIGTAFAHINSKEHNNYLASIYLLAILAFGVILVICVICMKPLVSFSQMTVSMILMMLCHSFGSFAFNFASIKYVYSRKAQYTCILSLILSVSMVLFSWIGITQKKFDVPQYWGRILGLAIPYIICAIYVTITIFAKGNPFIGWKRYINFCLPICLPLIFHGLSQVILAQTDKVMLQKMLSEYSSVGIYSFIITFVHIMNSIYIALNNTWVPIYYEYLKKKDLQSLFERGKRYHDLYIILAVGFLMLSPEVVKLFADSSYWVGIKLIPLALVSVYMVFAYSFAINYELYYRQTNLIAIGTTSAALANVILNALLIPLIGMYGAAIATVIAYVLLFVFHNICSLKINRGDYVFKWKYYAKYFLILLGFSILFYVFLDAVIVRWIIAVVAAMILINQIYRTKSIF